MKSFYLFVLLFAGFLLKAQEIEMYLLTPADFKNQIAKSSREFHLVYSFGYWCKPCRETMPQLMEVIAERTDIAFYPLMVEKLDSEAVPQNVDYLKAEFDYTGPVFSSDPALNKKPWKAYNALVEGLVTGHDQYGMSLILLFNKNGEVLLATNYNMSSEEKVEKLNIALIKN